MIQKNVKVLIAGGGPVGTFASLLLKRLGISNIVVETSNGIATHPKAHVLHARSMEMMRAVGLEKEIVEQVPPSEYWRRFRYCSSLLQETFAVDDHYRSPEFRELSKRSPCKVTQLSQPRFEKILKHALGNDSIYYKHKLVHLEELENGKIRSTMSHDNNNTVSVESDFVLAADGAQSSIRDMLKIHQLGQRDMETFASVHFTSKDLSSRLGPNERAMLTFVFNSEVMGVVVSHDIRHGEWVFHGPVFPPAQDAADFLDKQLCLRLVSSAIGAEMRDLKIESVQLWGMHAVIANSFSGMNNKVFLIGDAAHQFPPSGGFGVNAGLGDVYNLIWKLYYVLAGKASPSLLASYDIERRQAVSEALSVAVDNYRRGLVPAQMLGLDRATIAAAMPFLQKENASGFLKLGRMQLNLPGTSSRIRDAIEKERIGLPLIFPRLDVGYEYSSSPIIRYQSNEIHKPKVHDRNFWVAPCCHRYEQAKVPVDAIPGKLLPHAWVEQTSTGERVSTIDIIARNYPRYTLITCHPDVEMKNEDIAVVTLLGDKVSGSKSDTTFTCNEKWFDECGLHSTDLVLVRPDGHICWRGCGDNLVQVASELDSILRK